MADKKAKNRSKGRCGDRVLVRHLRQCIETYDSERGRPDVEDLADDLKSMYREYGRKRKDAFVWSVGKAYDELCEDEGIRDIIAGIPEKGSAKDWDSDESISSGDHSLVEYQDTDAMNQMVSSLRRTAGSESVCTSGTSTPVYRTPVRDNLITTDNPLKGLGFIDRSGARPLVDSPKPERSSEKRGKKRKSPLSLESFLPTPNSDALIPGPVSVSSTPGPVSVASTPAQTTAGSPQSKKLRKRATRPQPKSVATAVEAEYSSMGFSDIGGVDDVLLEVAQLIRFILYPEVAQAIGMVPTKGLLLHGPPGCGKTLLAHCIAGQSKLPMFKLTSTEVVSGVSGESEQTLRNLFDKAMDSAPCILFIDEIDAISQKRENATKDMERRIVTQLASCLDDLVAKESNVVVIGATNSIDSLDSGLRRAGRLEKEIGLGMPDVAARTKILEIVCKKMTLDDGVLWKQVALMTPGYVGADLVSLANTAAMMAGNRLFSEIESSMKQSTDTEMATSLEPKQSPGTDSDTPTKAISLPQALGLEAASLWLSRTFNISAAELSKFAITMDDFKAARKLIKPSALREGFATVPDVTMDDVGALKSVRSVLFKKILAPIKYPDECARLGVRPSGILLAGPPGCGKTLLAKAIANESGINFLSVKGPELLDKYVGESERAVRQVFQRARLSAPCVIFFDELDSLCRRRSDGSGDGGAQDRVVNQILTEMDGVEDRKQVFLIGATNIPEVIDPAILRPGRLDETLYVGLPTTPERLDILKKLTKNGEKPQCADDVDFEKISSSEKCANLSGADLSLLVDNARYACLMDFIHSKTPSDNGLVRLPVVSENANLIIRACHFELALKSIIPSVTEKGRLKYERMKAAFAQNAEQTYVE